MLPALPIGLVTFLIQRSASREGVLYLKRLSWVWVVFVLLGIALAWAYSYPWQAGDITQQRSTTRSFLTTWVLLWVIGFIVFGYRYWKHRIRA